MDTSATALAEFISLAINKESREAEIKHNVEPVFVERPSAGVLLVKRRNPDGRSVIHRITIEAQAGKVDEIFVGAEAA